MRSSFRLFVIKPIGLASQRFLHAFYTSYSLHIFYPSSMWDLVSEEKKKLHARGLELGPSIKKIEVKLLSYKTFSL